VKDKLIYLIFAVIIIAFFAGIFFDKPNLFPAVIGFPIVILALFLGLLKRIGLGFIVVIIGALLITGGMFLQKEFAKTFYINNVQAATIVQDSAQTDTINKNTVQPVSKGGGKFIVDAQNINYEMPAPKKSKAKSAPTTSSKDCVYFSRYPDQIKPWCGLIEKYAKKYDVDPLLIASVMWQESGGQSDAYSSSGAVGLMQVMPRDGIAAKFMCAKGPCFTTRPSMEELFDPEFNIEFGTRMLAGLIKKFGSERDALYSYGPMDVGYYYADLVLGIRNGL
jgi:hypothetical protein